LALAFDNAGKSIPARIAMIAITTRSSMSVKAGRRYRGAESREEVLVRFFIVYSLFIVLL
jgi:hypothetical protein